MPVDSEGMVDRGGARAPRRAQAQGRRCKLIYTIVNFQNPSGPTMSLRRRQELIALAHEYDTLILEDDAYGEIRFEGEPLPSLYALDPRRPRDPRGHRVQDPRRGLPARLAVRAQGR